MNPGYQPAPTTYPTYAGHTPLFGQTAYPYSTNLPPQQLPYTLPNQNSSFPFPSPFPMMNTLPYTQPYPYGFPNGLQNQYPPNPMTMGMGMGMGMGCGMTNFPPQMMAAAAAASVAEMEAEIDPRRREVIDRWREGVMP